MAYTRRPSVPTGRGSLKKPEQGHGPHPSPAGGGPIQALLRRYTRNPMPTPHGLKGGPLSGLSRPPRTRQLALYRITFCRRSEMTHTTRNAILHFIFIIKKQQIQHYQDNIFFISYYLLVRQTASFPKMIINQYL